MEVCTECGARLTEESNRCDLCGWEETGNQFDQPELEPADSNLPYRRDVPLQTIDSPSPPIANSKQNQKRSMTADSGIGLQISAILGVGVLLVITLFLVTVTSKRVSPSVSQTPSVPPTVDPIERAPLTGDLAARISEIDQAISEDSSALTGILRREKLSALIEGGRVDLAADVQSKIAEETGLEEDWKTAGNLYYEWMVEESEPQTRSRIADQAVNAYQEVLSLNPENLDVRTDMATAYLNTGTPMIGVTEIKKVLEIDPLHLNANFNYGLMLARINRVGEAITQLEFVLTLAPDPSSIHHQRASTLISSIREQTNL